MTNELTRVLDEEARRTDAEGKWPERSMKTLAESGVLGLTLPRESGGEGAGMRKFAEVTEQIAMHCASTAMIYLMHVCGAQVIVASSSPRRSELAQKIAAGKRRNGDPCADWHAGYDARHARGDRDDERLPDDGPRLRIARRQQQDSVDETRPQFTPVFPAHRIHAASPTSIMSWIAPVPQSCRLPE